MKQKIFEVDSIDTYNKWHGVETLHPLVTVIDIKESPDDTEPIQNKCIKRL